MYSYGAQDWKVHSISNTGGARPASAVKNEDLESSKTLQQLHLSVLEPSSDIKVICISNILRTVVLRITLKPNGKLSGNFVWLDMGLPNIEKESNTLNFIRDY